MNTGAAESSVVATGIPGRGTVAGAAVGCGRLAFGWLVCVGFCGCGKIRRKASMAWSSLAP
jgi:hypothetical protein